jgi:hypothetical protein
MREKIREVRELGVNFGFLNENPPFFFTYSFSTLNLKRNRLLTRICHGRYKKMSFLYSANTMWQKLKPLQQQLTRIFAVRGIPSNWSTSRTHQIGAFFAPKFYGFVIISFRSIFFSKCTCVIYQIMLFWTYKSFGYITFSIHFFLDDLRCSRIPRT